ncbi:MAG TPA: hypothetical protein PK280_01205 [Planctomycetota bacterium]|nr:hypothetical protein [Planctomycetota bacterium]
METPRFDKPGPRPQPSPRAILTVEPRGAIARRNRTLKLYAAVLLAVALVLTGYCVLRPGFDLSTPERTMASFKKALDDRRWSLAEKCLTADCHAHYAPAIADRTLFDFYSPHGYDTPFGRFIPNWKVRRVERTSDSAARVWVASGMPFVQEEQAGFYMYLVRSPDGLWRIDGPRERFAEWYELLIPKDAQGWAAAEERR